MLTLRTYHLLELAINVVQNGWTLEEAYDNVDHSDRSVMLLGECAAADAQPSALAMHATRAMLEDIYKEVLRQNLEAVSLVQLAPATGSANCHRAQLRGHSPPMRPKGVAAETAL